MCSKEEEPVILQQFLRFGETRPITQQLLLQELSDRHNEENKLAKAQSEIKKLIDSRQNSRATPPGHGHAHHPLLHRPGSVDGGAKLPPSSPLHGSAPPPLQFSPKAAMMRHFPAHSPPSSSASRATPPLNPTSLASHLATSAQQNHVSSASSAASSPNHMNGGSKSPGSQPPTSPLGRLQSMHPFDYKGIKGDLRRSTPEDLQRAAAAAIERPLPPSMRLPPQAAAAQAAAMAAAAAAGFGLPMMPGHPGFHNAMANNVSQVRIRAILLMFLRSCATLCR